MIKYKEGIDSGGVDRRIMNVLKWLVATIGDFTVTCLTRDEDENAAVGGHENSFHLYGMAVDITLPDVAYERVKRVLLSNFGGIQAIHHRGHLHIEIDGDPEGKVWLKE